MPRSSRKKRGLDGRSNVRDIVADHIADIAGVQALRPENDIRALLIDDLQTNLDKLTETNIDTLTFNELRQWTKWIKASPQQNPTVHGQRVRQAENEMKVTHARMISEGKLTTL